jgi:hypothetical protein
MERLGAVRQYNKARCRREGSSEAAELSEVGCYFWISKSVREMLPLVSKATALAVKFHFLEIEAELAPDDRLSWLWPFGHTSEVSAAVFPISHFRARYCFSKFSQREGANASRGQSERIRE